LAEQRFQRYNADRASAIRDVVALIHRKAYAEQIAADDPFSSEEAFMRRFDAYTARPDFDMVVAYRGGEPVGQAWGWPLNVHSGEAWWRGLVQEPEPGFTHEDGSRTFALSEIMVGRAWAGRGVGHALHDELLSARPETRAVLLVRPHNTTAYRAYTRWGWRKAGELRPNVPHAPVMDILILPLPISPP
jgi:ribosomal protein S18 acetylase RimI-like enzyme